MLPIICKKISLPQSLRVILALVRRFPLVIVASIVFTITGIMLIGSMAGVELSKNSYEIFQNLMLTATLALPLLTALALIGERYKNTVARSLQGVGMGVLVIYYLTRGGNERFFAAEQALAIFFFTGAAYLLLLAVPFFYKLDCQKAWNFWRTLAMRFITTFVYGLILFIGLALALTAVRFLFDLQFSVLWYHRIWFAVVGIFGVWYFLAGLPVLKKDLEDYYPRALKTLFLWILLPLLALFLIILYVYVAKIIFMWSWPKDGVAQWILGCSAFGMICFLIAYPLLDIYKQLRRFFFLAALLFIPLFVVLFLGIGLRISAYGFTINRLMVVLAGSWVLVLIAYFLIVRLKGKIVYVPLSLAILCVVASLGPWSIFNIAAQSQLGRLESLLQINGLLVNGTPIKGPSVALSNEARRDIISIISYLAAHHNLQGRRVWIDQIIGDKPIMSWEGEDKIMDYFGLNRYNNF